MVFGSWTFPLDKIDIRFMKEEENTTEVGLDTSDYQDSNEWFLYKDEPSCRNERNDSLDTTVQYAELKYTVKIRRKSSYYIFVLIIPCILLSFLTLVVFWLPPEAPAKMLLGNNIHSLYYSERVHHTLRA